jgi:hypothetical protein
MDFCMCFLKYYRIGTVAYFLLEVFVFPKFSHIFKDFSEDFSQIHRHKFVRFFREFLKVVPKFPKFSNIYNTIFKNLIIFFTILTSKSQNSCFNLFLTRKTRELHFPY